MGTENYSMTNCRATINKFLEENADKKKEFQRLLEVNKKRARRQIINKNKKF